MKRPGPFSFAPTEGQARLLAYALMVAGGVLAALSLGKDFNWDQLSYHVYAGFSAVEQRLALDYFAASTTGYFNPYAHVPFYLMLKHGLAPQAVVGLLALFHVLNLLIVYEMAVLLNRRSGGAIAWPAVACAVALAFLNPVFILELGNSFNEISTSVLVLGAWYLLMRGFDAPRAGGLALAGVLLGAAAALKLSNLAYSVTALPLLLFAPTPWRARAKAVLLFALAGLLGAVLAGGWWAWQLWTLFGNPFGPFFNDYFHSPHFATGAVKHYRFLSASALDQLLKPFVMVLPSQSIHFEKVAPDLRYAALVLLAALCAIKCLPGAPRFFRDDPVPAFEGRRLFAAVGAAFLAAWLVWATASGNSRYFLPMACVAGLLLGSLLFRFSGKRRWLAYAVVPLVLLQAAMTGCTSELRWTPTGYGKAWFELDIPPALQQEHALYLTLNTMTASFLMPYLPREASMINISGMTVMEENARTRALMAKYQGHVRAMRRYGGDMVKDRPLAKQFNYALAKFGLEVDIDDCQTIKHLQRNDGAADTYIYYSACRTRPLSWPPEQRQAYLDAKRESDRVFASLEALCPHFFQPRGQASDGDGSQFWRSYGNTDMVVQQYESGLVTYRNVFTHGQDVRVGYVKDLARAMPPKAAVCPQD